jgi:hypothetical protein
MDSIKNYFTAEKHESVLFVLVGISAVILALYFLLKLKQPFYNGMAYAFIAIALIQVGVGTSVWLRSAKDIERVSNMVRNNTSKIETEEIPRMNVVMKNFILYRWVEIALMLIGLIAFFCLPSDTFWKGLGLGLFIQAAFMLLLDYFAESRGKVYLEFLKSI